MASLFSPPISSSSLHNPNFIPKFSFSLLSTNRFSLLSVTRANSSPSSNSGITDPVAVVVKEAPPSTPPAVKKEEIATTVEVGEEMKTTETLIKFEDAKWVNGTWDLKQFEKDGKTDWDSVIVAEAKRRKWLEENPETTSNEEPVLFDTSIIPWWAWIKRYHLPEAEILN
ncbi:unnamed protein product, partial [Microthlaspi erraticum]